MKHNDQQIKRIQPLLLAIAALAGVMLLALAVMFLIRARGGAESGSGKDAPYPYAWTENSDGTIALTLDGSAVEDGAWAVGTADGNMVTAALGETKRGKTAATLTPVSEGRETVTFSLLRGEDRLAEASFTVDTEPAEDGGYAATILSHGERVFQETVRGGDEAYPFTVRADDEGGLTVSIADTEEYEGTGWTAVSSDTLVAAADVATLWEEEKNGGVQVTLEPRANGSAEVTVSNETADLAYVFAVEVSGGEMRLTGSRTETHEEETAEFEPVENDYGDDDAPEEEDPFDGKMFTFTPRSAAGMRLDLAADDAGSRTIPRLYHAYRYVVQQWRVTRVGTAECNGEQQPCYRLVSLYNAQALDSGDGAESLWFFEDAGDNGYYYLIPTGDTAKCLTARGTQDGAAVTLAEKTNGIGQRWQLTETVEIVELGTYTLSPKRAPELALALADGASGIGAKLGLRGVSDGVRWTFTRLGVDVIDGVETSYYKIVNADTGLAIDVPGTNAVTSGKPLQQWYYDDNDDQLWYLEDMGDGYYAIISRADRNVVLGTAVQTWERSGDDAQQWKLTER